MARWLATGYTTVMRGLPGARHLSPGLFFAGVVALAMVFGAFAAEVMRSAIRAVPPGQIETAILIGMSRGRLFCRVTPPLALRSALPGLV